MRTDLPRPAAAKAACAARRRSTCAFPRACRPARACAFPGHGNAGTHGAPPGDLYIITEVQPHPYFERRGDDLYTVVPITVTEAALGAKIEVPTLDGRSLLRVPPGTNSGQKLRLREKGVPSVRQPGKRGDLYVELQVVVPKPVDERVRNLLRELAKLEPEDPRSDLFARAGLALTAEPAERREKSNAHPHVQEKEPRRLHDQRRGRAL